MNCTFHSQNISIFPALKNAHKRSSTKTRKKFLHTASVLRALVATGKAGRSGRTSNSKRTPHSCTHKTHTQAPGESTRSFADALNDPVLLAQWAPVVFLHPQGHAAVVEGVVALAPHHHAVVLFVFVLTPQTGIHHLNTTYGAGITLYVPTPHGHSVPLLKNKHFVWLLPVSFSILVNIIFV